MKSTASFPLAACFILLHLSLVPSGQAAVSECLFCTAISAEADICKAGDANIPPNPACASLSSQDNAAADACIAGNPANVPKVACPATPFAVNHGCSVTVRKVGGITALQRSCCSDVDGHPGRCQDDLHQKLNGQELDADSCLTDNCNTMDPRSSAVMTKMFPCTILLLVLLFTSV